MKRPSENPSRGSRMKKGRTLERAVHFIQEAILSADPKLKGTEFRIESNKIVNVSGVRHEIDVLVTTHPDTQYESTWVFDCKNQKQPVGKNAVIILAEKVNALHANRGILVTERITQDAKAQLAQDRRLNFARCTAHFMHALQMSLTHTVHDALPLTVSISERNASSDEPPKELDWQNLKCRLNGVPIDFPTFIDDQIGQLVSEDHRENSAKYLHEGTHWSEQAMDVRFQQGELIIDDMDVERLAIPVRFLVTVQKHAIISKFELENQGRVFSFKPIADEISGKQIEINVVHRI